MKVIFEGEVPALKRFFFIGEISKRLVDSQCLNDINVVGGIKFSSPISLGQTCELKKTDDVIQDETNLDINKTFSALLDLYHSDYILIDLSGLTMHLFVKGNIYYTVPCIENDQVGCYNAWKETEINPVDYEPSYFYTQFDQFAEKIMKYFSGNKIILLHVHYPHYFRINGYVRDAGDTGPQMWLDDFEHRFIENTSCHFIDVTKFYFSQKTGDEINPLQYEEWAYKNIGIVIDEILSDNTHKAENQLSFLYSYKRYSEFFGNLSQKFLDIFLDPNNVTDQFVRTCPPEFINTYIDSFVELRTLNPSTLSEAEKYLFDYKFGLDFQKVFQAYCAVREERYYDSAVDYNYLFVNKLQIPELLSFVRKHINWQNYGLTDKQVNYHNYGYWFFRVQSADPDNFDLLQKSGAFVKKYEEDETVNLKPTLIDVWGSCVSRQIINFNEENLAANVYLFQISPLGINNVPVSYDDKIIDANPNKWRNRMARISLDHTACDLLDRSGAHWMILDFWVLSSGNIFKYEDQYFNLDSALAKTMHTERINLYNNEELIRMVKDDLQQFADYLKRRYGQNIIVIKTKRSEHYITHNGEIRNFGNIKINQAKNRFTNQCNEYLVNYLDCYYIDLVDQFLSSELGLFELAPTHYELELYKIEGKIVQGIIDGTLDSKRYTTYSNDIRLNRIERLIEKNKGNPVLKDIFSDNLLDQYVLEMDEDTIKKYHYLIVELYDMKFKSMTEVMDYIEKTPKYFPLSALFQQDKKVQREVSQKAIQQKEEKVSSFKIVYSAPDNNKSMSPTNVVYGQVSNLSRNEYKKKGYWFKGWYGFRESDQKLCYEDEMKKQRFFYTPGKEPSGWVPHIYKDGCSVAYLSKVDGDTIVMKPQWVKEQSLYAAPEHADENKQILLEKLLYRPIVLFGAGERCRNFYRRYHKLLNIRCILTDKKEEKDFTLMNGKTVKVEPYSKDKIQPNDYIIVCRPVKIWFDQDYENARSILTRDGFRHMDDFLRIGIARVILDNKKLWLWMGFCQYDTLRDIFGRFESIKQKYVLIGMRVGKDTVKSSYKYKDCQDMLKICDVLIYTPILFNEEKADFDFKDFLPKDAVSLSIPRIAFRGYYPYKDRDIEIHHKYTYDGDLHWPFSYAENYLDELILRGLSDDEIYEMVMKDDFIDENSIKRNLKLAYKSIQISEETSDIKILDFIKENFTKCMLYRDGLHYQNLMYFEIARRLADRLGLDCRQEIDNLEKEIKQNGTQYIDFTEIPVLPCVAKTLGLDFITDDTLWRVKFTEDGKYRGKEEIRMLTRKEWIYAYLAYTRAHMTLSKLWNLQNNDYLSVNED